MTAVHTDRSSLVKDAIRDSARRLFTAQGFEATGVRDIAADAGVNPAIVIRHFGSKERLFVMSIDAPAKWRALLEGPLETLGERVTRALLRGQHNGLPIWGAMVRASGRPDIHDHLKRSVVALFAEPLVERLAGPDAELRAHLFAAQLVGIMSALVVYDDEFVMHAPVESVVAHYGRSLQLTLTPSG
ncbi:transcriptional regulator, TetR family [Plantibacter sp. VKM Ac-1784]|uniref:Transcriptional regulator, TetR family n=1 Tax=Plantibacter elymi (nom. nud.) TaxID=199708 RepID=A0ABY1REA5_9MICO|nr:TetR family transcriptional regulator [Plantibacter sp. VKM Ac-1784]SMQ71257.1 transcriptional regulator, TetR family [Plantibacter sp. VKM Ac-1784]